MNLVLFLTSTCMHDALNWIMVKTKIVAVYNKEMFRWSATQTLKIKIT
jgi:hypothetical protein